MYSLTLIKRSAENRAIYSRQVLGEWYELEFYPEGKDSVVAASIKYGQGDGLPVIEVNRSDEAYITLLTGETVHVVCRGRTTGLLTRE